MGEWMNEWMDEWMDEFEFVLTNFALYITDFLFKSIKL